METQFKFMKPKIFIVLGLAVLATALVFSFTLQKAKDGTKKDLTKKNTRPNVEEQEAGKLGRNFGGMPTLPDDPPGTLEKQMISLEEAQKRVPVEIAIPSYLPKGTTLKGVIIFSKPSDVPPFKENGNYEINLYYTNDLQIAEYTAHKPFDVENFLHLDTESLPTQVPDAQGKKHAYKKIKVKGKVGVGKERSDQVLGQSINHVPSDLTFDMASTGEFGHLWVGILAKNHSLEETIKIGESMEYPE